MINVRDLENDTDFILDTSDARVRARHADRFTERLTEFRKTFARCKSDTLVINTNDSYIAALQQFFKRRAGMI